MYEREPITLEWDGAGYGALRAAGSESAWEGLSRVVDDARRGVRSRVSQLQVAEGQDHDLAYQIATCTIIGDAGDAETLERLLPVLESSEFELGLRAAHALATRGRLLDVPAVFFFYELNKGVKDAVIIRQWLRRWLSEPGDTTLEPVDNPGDDLSWSDYRKQIGQRYFALWNKFGTLLVHVKSGHLFELGRLVTEMLAELRAGRLHTDDRHIFEANTGWDCSEWFDQNGEVKPLRAAADLERYADSGAAARFVSGQRLFMGHPLEDARAAEKVLAKYPSQAGLEAPFARITFEVDADFELDLGFNWVQEGYFYSTPSVAPSARVHPSMPWLSLHVALRESKRGAVEPVEQLAALIDPKLDGMLCLSMIELVADAADESTIAPWRQRLSGNEPPTFVLDLCVGLLSRGLLRDVPLVLETYKRLHEQPDFWYLQQVLNELLAFEPVCMTFQPKPDVAVFCADIQRRYLLLRERFGRDDLPIFRGQLFSATAVAQEVIVREHGPSLRDLRHRFESNIGVDCSSWFAQRAGDTVDPTTAIQAARAFLNSDRAQSYSPGELYFFGRKLQR